MIKKYNRYILVVILLIVVSNFTGCTLVDDIEKKLGWKNEYFEYLNTNNVEQISIQSARDTGFKFIVTEENSIKEMYNLLAKAKVSENKSTLEPDYIFEFDLGDEVEKFYYVVGSDEGNFYNDTNTFTVSNRLDEGIIKNLSFIRKPRDFEYVYYNSIYDVLKKLKKEGSIDNYTVGININGDIDCLKYIFSTDLKTFQENAKKIIHNIELINNNENDFDVVIEIKNRGYDTTNYKTLITVNNKKENTVEEYYVVAVNEFKEWNINITEERPSEW